MEHISQHDVGIGESMDDADSTSADAVAQTEADAQPLALHMWRGQIRPRAWSIILSWPTGVAAIVTALVVTALPGLPSASAQIDAAATIGLNVAAISMGACISALVLSLALPGEKRLREWARLDNSNGRSQLEQLLFTYFFAASCQVVTIFACVASMLFGSGLQLVASEMTPSHYLGLMGGFFVFFFGTAQLWVVLQTLMQTGVLIIVGERKPDTSK